MYVFKYIHEVLDVSVVSCARCTAIVSLLNDIPHVLFRSSSTSFPTPKKPPITIAALALSQSSLTRNQASLGPYSRTVLRALW